MAFPKVISVPPMFGDLIIFDKVIFTSCLYSFSQLNACKLAKVSQVYSLMYDYLTVIFGSTQ